MAKKSVTLTITHRLHEEVMAHLFPGDGEEHGLIILAGLASHEGHQATPNHRTRAS